MVRYKPQKLSKRHQTKRRKKDLDEIYEDIQPENAAKIKNRPLDEDLPGLGQFYCIACSRYFTDAQVLEKHCATRPHKRRVKKLEAEKPYGVDKEDAYGMKIDNGH